MQHSSRRRFLKAAAASAAVASLVPQRLIAASPAPFYKALGVCTSIKNAKKVKAVGGQYIEESVRRLLIPHKSDTAFAKNLELVKASPLPVEACNGFLHSRLKCTGPKAKHDRVLKFADVAFKRAKQAGVKIIVFGSSGARNIPKGWSREKAEKQFVELLKKMGPLAAACGVTVAVEPLNSKETNFIIPITEGAAICEKVNHPNVQIVADIYHMLRNGEPAENIRKCAKYIHHVHIAEKAKRTAPGMAGDDFRSYFKALKDINYNGRISIEGKWKWRHLAKGFKTIRSQVADVMG